AGVTDSGRRGGPSRRPRRRGRRRPPLALIRASQHHHCRLKPALRLFEASPVGVSLTVPVTLNGPPNSFCPALREGSPFWSVLERLAPTDTLVSVGSTLKRSAWLRLQPWSCVVALGSGLVTARPFCQVAVRFSPTGTERLKVVPTLLCCCDGSTRVSIEVWSQPSGASSPGAVTVAQPTPLD